MWSDFRKIRIKLLDEAIKNKRVDADIISLLQKINENKDLVTVSSCFGRIVLLEFDITKTKKTARFYQKWHRKVNTEEVELALSQYTGKLPLWFKVEPFILHVAAKDMKSALNLYSKIRGAGVKRGGVQGIQKDRVTIEVQGTAGISLPADAFEGSWDELILIANKMMELNEKQIRKLEKIKL